MRGRVSRRVEGWDVGARGREAVGSGECGSVLEVEDIRVHFGSLCAVDGATLRVAGGEVGGLVGTNGAGKSTLVNAIAGALRADSGSVKLGGVEIGGLASWERARRGVGRVFQNLELFETMTVRENVLCGRDWMGRYSPKGRGVCEALADRALDDVGLTALSRRIVGELSYPDRKLVEFARALAMDARVLLLDEPTAGVAIEDRSTVVSVLKGVLEARHGLAVLVVEHDIAVIEALCTVVHVMASGKLIFSGHFEDMLKDGVVREKYLGSVRDS